MPSKSFWDRSVYIRKQLSLSKLEEAGNLVTSKQRDTYTARNHIQQQTKRFCDKHFTVPFFGSTCTESCWDLKGGQCVVVELTIWCCPWNVAVTWSFMCQPSSSFGIRVIPGPGISTLDSSNEIVITDERGFVEFAEYYVFMFSVIRECPQVSSIAFASLLQEEYYSW